MKARIRPAVVADAAAIVSLGREIDRDQLATIDSFRAAALGITRILASNDRENAPMVAVNRKLGFTEAAIVESYAKAPASTTSPGGASSRSTTCSTRGRW